MQKLWYSTDDASAHEKSPPKHETAALKKPLKQGKYVVLWPHTSHTL
jgi:hypothetical protein